MTFGYLSNVAQTKNVWGAVNRQEMNRHCCIIIRSLVIKDEHFCLYTLLMFYDVAFTSVRLYY